MADAPETETERAGGSSHVSLSRAIVLVVSAFLIGLLILQADNRSPASQVSNVTATTMSTTSISTTTTTHPAKSSITTTTSTSISTTTTTHPAKSSATTGKSSSSTTTTSVAGSPSPDHVHVLVVNASGANGAGANLTSILTGDSWFMFAPVTATSAVATTVVYYASGYESSAQTVATQIKASSGAVQPLTSTVPVPAGGLGGADVVVVLGPDVAGPATTTTTSSTPVASTAS